MAGSQSDKDSGDCGVNSQMQTPMLSKKSPTSSHESSLKEYKAVSNVFWEILALDGKYCSYWNS